MNSKPLLAGLLEQGAKTGQEPVAERVPMLKTRWTKEDIDRLTEYWADGLPIEDIAKRLHFSYARVALKATRLKLPTRRNRPRDQLYTPLTLPGFVYKTSVSTGAFQCDDYEEPKEPEPPKVLPKQPRCKGPCGEEFVPAHSAQRICTPCRNAIRQMIFS